MTRLRADFLLLLTAFIWGTAFLAQKLGNRALAPAVFVGIRFVLSAAALVPLALWEARRRQWVWPGRRDLGLAVLAGLCLFAGAILQQTGLADTSVANGGFLTSLYVLVVPFFVWLGGGGRPRPMVLAACLCSVAGAWMLTSGGVAQRMTRGDAIVLAADFAWAGMIVLVPVFLRRTGRPFLLCAVQHLVTAVLGLAWGLLTAPWSWNAVPTAAPALLYAGLLSGGLAFTLQVVAQGHAPAVEAALILSLENVFAAVAGAVWLDERLSWLAIGGGGLILAGVLLPDLGAAAWRRLAGGNDPAGAAGPP